MGAALLLATLTGCVQPEPVLAQGPMVGHVDARSARIWVRTSEAAALRLRLSTRADFSAALSPVELKTSADDHFTGVFVCTGLKPDAEYHYRVLHGGKALASASFRTAPPDHAPGRVRFAFTSCAGKKGIETEPGWREMARKPDFDLLLQLGDNHYGDTTDLVKQRAQYVDHRSFPAFAEVAGRIPVYGVWDDHDYGPNNSDGTQEGKERSLRAFKEFWANPSYGEPGNDGVYFAFTRGNVDFILLDSRYNRDGRNVKGDRSMLGARQKAWLKERLKASRAAVRIVACGSEFQTFTTTDCWAGFLKERDEIMDFIRDEGIKGVIFISGDRHFVAGYQVRGEILEVTSGPFGSRNYTGKESAEQLFKVVQGKMYCVFDIDTRGREPVVKLEMVRAGDGVFDTRTFTWAQINGAKIPADR